MVDCVQFLEGSLVSNINIVANFAQSVRGELGLTVAGKLLV